MRVAAPPSLTDGPDDAERTVGFLVFDIEQALDELRSAGITTDAVVASSATQRYVHFRAPDGRLYELVEEIAVTQRPAEEQR